MRESVSQRERERERERERAKYQSSSSPLSLDYLAKPTMAHGGYSKRRVKPKPKSVSLKNRIWYQSTACLERYFSLADQWPWRREGADLLQHGVAELAELSFQTSSRRSVHSLSLSLCRIVIGKWATEQAAGKELKLRFKKIIIELIYLGWFVILISFLGFWGNYWAFFLYYLNFLCVIWAFLYYLVVCYVWWILYFWIVCCNFDSFIFLNFFLLKRKWEFKTKTRESTLTNLYFFNIYIYIYIYFFFFF